MIELYITGIVLSIVIRKEIFGNHRNIAINKMLKEIVAQMQKHHVTAFDISEERVRLVSNRKSPIKDTEIERCLAQKNLLLTATTDAQAAFSGADYIVIATPTDYNPNFNFLTPAV